MSTKERATNIFIIAIDEWQKRVMSLGGLTTLEAKEQANKWLNEFEHTYRAGMVNVDLAGGYDGFKTSRNFNSMVSSQKVYRDTYSQSVQAINTQDLDQARRLRNILAVSMKDNFDMFLNEINSFIEEGVKQGLSQVQLTEGFLQTKAFSDNVFLVDSIGRKWKPNHYASMYSRTRARQVEDDIMFDDLLVTDNDIVKITTTATTTPICLRHVGKYYSLSGKTKELPILEFRPPFHPNCVHHMIPVRANGIEAKELNKERTDLNISTLSKGEKKSLKKQESWLLDNRPNPFTSVKVA